jgi:hypothetical protein
MRKLKNVEKVEKCKVIKKYYHITPFKNYKTILKEGLKANSLGEIYVFDTNHRGVIEYASINQLYIMHCALFEIDAKGITGEIEDDNVGEYTSQYQKIIHQDLIKPEFLRIFITYRVENNINTNILNYKL